VCGLRDGPPATSTATVSNAETKPTMPAIRLSLTSRARSSDHAAMAIAIATMPNAANTLTATPHAASVATAAFCDAGEAATNRATIREHKAVDQSRSEQAADPDGETYQSGDDRPTRESATQRVARESCEQHTEQKEQRSVNESIAGAERAHRAKLRLRTGMAVQVRMQRQGDDREQHRAGD
jgi:hypothetical protein